MITNKCDVMAKRIVFVTSNRRKYEEVKEILASSFIEIHWEYFSYLEIQGESDDITKYKCIQAAKHFNVPVLVEDTCLCFTALNGLPGPYVKEFIDKIGLFGLNKLLEGWKNKEAYGVCTFGYCPDPQKEDVLLFKGKIKGIIVEPRGPMLFGWDPCFQPDGYKETFAEMSLQLKNSISHRSQALKSLMHYFSNLNYTI